MEAENHSLYPPKCSLNRVMIVKCIKKKSPKLLASTTNKHRGPVIVKTKKLYTNSILNNMFTSIRTILNVLKITSLTKILTPIKNSDLSQVNISVIWRNILLHILMDYMV